MIKGNTLIVPYVMHSYLTLRYIPFEDAVFRGYTISLNLTQDGTVDNFLVRFTFFIMVDTQQLDGY